MKLCCQGIEDHDWGSPTCWWSEGLTAPLASAIDQEAEADFMSVRWFDEGGWEIVVGPDGTAYTVEERDVAPQVDEIPDHRTHRR